MPTKETPSQVHGRALEALHIGGYGVERSLRDLKWLLEEDRWQRCGEGYEDIELFLETFSLADYKIAISERKEIVKLLAEKRATQRAIAQAVGVDKATVNRDLNPVANATKTPSEPPSQKELERTVVANASPPNPTGHATELLDAAERAGKQEDTQQAHVANNSGENEWYTPKVYVEAAREAMGAIDCDPASSALANETVRADVYYTKENNGLSQTWSGSAFLNPPYSHPEIVQFIEALCEKYVRNEVKEAVVLVNNATDTAWFQSLLARASAVCFPRGRIKFIDKQGNPSGAPLQGQAVVYIGEENTQQFRDIFSKFGAVLWL